MRRARRACRVKMPGSAQKRKCRLANVAIAGGWPKPIVDRRSLSAASQNDISAQAGHPIGSHHLMRPGLERWVATPLENDMTIRDALESGRTCAERVPYSVIAFVSRFAVAAVFWRSGQTKVEGFSIREETFFLFREEYK